MSTFIVYAGTSERDLYFHVGALSFGEAERITSGFLGDSITLGDGERLLVVEAYPHIAAEPKLPVMERGDIDRWKMDLFPPPGWNAADRVVALSHMATLPTLSPT